jgi:(R,R)-butanediol dehydrogenase / meso-butanediol dehydrogenase / diacetyl reductase
MMRAVRLYGVGDLRFENVAEPGPPAAGELRLQVRAAGVCGSDLHNFRTGQWISRVPSIPGHEFAAVVLEIGSEVEGFSPGDLVVADSRMNCGQCPACLANRPNVCVRMGYVGEVCDGGFAEIVNLPACRVLHVPCGVPPDIAALTEPLGVALRVVRRLDPSKNVPILIAGAGPIGGLATILLDHFGFGPLAILERNPDRAHLVSSITGATLLTSSESDVLSFARPALRYAIEATGSQAMLTFLMESLTGGGCLAMVGLFSGQPTVNANALVERELDIRGCSVFCDEQREVLPLLRELMPKLAQVVSPPVSLEELPAEYAHLLSGKSKFLKTLVQP